jgi:peptide chain release factor subunit 1
MLTLEQIKQLEAFDGGGARVLSVYLDLRPDRHLKHAYHTVFKDLLKEARGRVADESERETLQSEGQRVQSWLNEQELMGKGLAVFSCSSGKLWQAQWLPVRIEDHLAFEPKPDVAPLLEILDDYQRYAVAAVDKRHARLFTVFMGEIEENMKFQDFVFSHHDQGGWSQANYQRHHEAHVFRHLKRVAAYLTDLYRRREFDRLIVAGPEEVTSELRRILPRNLAQQLAATIAADTSAGEAEILQRTLDVERQIERQYEERLLDDLFETAGAGGRAVLRLAPTLEALWLGEVQTLIVAAGIHGGGCECPSCWRLAPENVRSCPACGTPMELVHDLFHRAMGRTAELDGSVEVVHDDAARRLVERDEGIGAMLRYR